MTPESLANSPWDAPRFVFTPGRHYDAMFFIKIPRCAEHPQGGDVTALLWRFDKDPTEWIFTYRFRYYKSPDPFAPGDEKSWYAMKAKADPAKARFATDKALAMIAELVPKFFGGETPTIHRFEIDGDAGKWFDLIQKSPPFWMHVQSQSSHSE